MDSASQGLVLTQKLHVTGVKLAPHHNVILGSSSHICSVSFQPEKTSDPCSPGDCALEVKEDSCEGVESAVTGEPG